MKDDPSIEGIRRLLQDGLKMEPGATLLILCQDDRLNLAMLMGEIAASLGLQVDQRRFSAQDFADKYPPAFSPPRLAEAEPVPQGVVLLIEWSVKTTRGRLELLRQFQATGRRWRIASMPGVTLTDLPLCRAPIDEIHQKSFLVFAALARAKFALVRTPKPDGGQDKLIIPITEYCPNLSTGAIEAGTWGNFPSGETFVIPNPDASYGWMTLRGSFPRYVLGDDEWLRFEFVAGRLQYKSIEASSELLRTRFTQLFFNSNGKVAFKNSNTLAELGVGTNAAITHLTGNPIFDEKQAGTIHLGLGSNTQFNGPVASDAHNDITCLDATLETQTVTIVAQRHLVISPGEAMPSLRLAGRFYKPPEGTYKQTQRASYEFNDDDEVLYLTYSPYRGGPLRVPIQSTGVMDIAKWILTEANRRPVTLDTLLATLPTKFKSNITKDVFSGLADLGLLEITNAK